MNFTQFRAGRVFATLTVLTLMLPTRAVFAQPANEPSEDSFVTDGIVYSVAENNNVLYVGGLFTQAGRRSGGAVPVSGATGAAETSFPRVNGSVNAIIPDGQGGW